MDSANDLEKENPELVEIRSKNREEILAERDVQRKFLLRKARYSKEDSCLGSFNEKNLKSLAQKIKTKNQVSPELLMSIMNGLLENKENVTLFLSVDGALQALLRELSGQNEKHQLIAARCICNLALGTEKQSLQVLKAAESYLMVHLSGKNYYIIEACLIAIGNFGHQGVKHIDYLQKQGFIHKIIDLLHCFDESVKESAVYALSQIVYAGFDNLDVETLEKSLIAVLGIFQKFPSSHLAFLVFLLTSVKQLQKVVLSYNIHIQTLNCLSEALKRKENEALYYLRILNNCVCEETGQIAADLLRYCDVNLKECILLLLNAEEKHLQKECLGFMGNLFNQTSQELKEFIVKIVNENLNQVEGIVAHLKKLSGDTLQ